MRQEKEELYAKFEEEFEECEQYWEEKLSDYGESLKRLENEIRINQEEQLKEYKEAFESHQPNLNRLGRYFHKM
jgi:ElaB/YqjD/DUF883 family membrane-anchored ribosome-binding protein